MRSPTTRSSGTWLPVQSGARRDGIAGIYGNPGNVRICNLQNLKGRVGFESHPLRQHELICFQQLSGPRGFSAGNASFFRPRIRPLTSWKIAQRWPPGRSKNPHWHRPCRPLPSCRGLTGGKFSRKTAGTADWLEARAIADAYERANSWTGERKTQPVASEPALDNALRPSTPVEMHLPKKRTISAAGKTGIAAAEKKRWPAFKKTKKKTQVAAVRGQRRTPPNRRWPTIAQDPLTPARVLTTGPDRCIRSNGTRLQCGRQTECDLD